MKKTQREKRVFGFLGEKNTEKRGRTVGDQIQKGWREKM